MKEGADAPIVDPARSAWLYQRNPSGDRTDPTIWICRRNGSIVGSEAAIPFDLKVGKAQRRAHWAVNVFVDPEWRGTGVAHELTLARQAYSMSCGLGLSNDGLRHALRHDTSLVGTMHMFVHPVDLRSVLDPATATRPWLELASPLVRVAGSARALLGGLCRARATTVSIDRFDDRADAIWREASPHYSVISRRDAEWLRWRFDDAPHAQSYARYYVLRGERPVGYFVLHASGWRGLSAHTIVDYLSRPGDLAALFASAATAARGLGGEVLVCETLNAHAGAPLRAAGYLRVRTTPDVAELTVHTNSDDSWRDHLCVLANWFVTRADSDVDADP
jgi:hypothetical protein